MRSEEASPCNIGQVRYFRRVRQVAHDGVDHSLHAFVFQRGSHEDRNESALDDRPPDGRVNLGRCRIDVVEELLTDCLIAVCQVFLRAHVGEDRI